MGDTVRIEITVRTGFVGCDHTDYVEFPRESWDAMTEQERENVMQEHEAEARARFITTSWEVVEG